MSDQSQFRNPLWNVESFDAYFNPGKQEPFPMNSDFNMADQDTQSVPAVDPAIEHPRIDLEAISETNTGVPERETKFYEFCASVWNEICSAREKFPPMHSEHEGIAIIEEEFLELRAAVFTKGPNAAQMSEECIQLAAMVCCFWNEVLDW